jgi:hypothetical protein
VVPGVNDPDTDNLEIAASILGGLGSSRLDNALVRQDKTAVSVSAGVQVLEKISFLTVNADVRPGVDPAVVSKRLDALIADFLRTGPTVWSNSVPATPYEIVSGGLARAHGWNRACAQRRGDPQGRR